MRIAGVAAEGHRNHDALAQSAGELVRVLSVPLFRVGDAHPVQHPDREGAGFLPGSCPVEKQHFVDLSPHGVHGGEARHGLLEDHGYLAAPYRAYRGGIFAEPGYVDDASVAAAEFHASCHDRAGIGYDLKYRLARDALAAARFSDDAEDFAPGKIEVHAIHGLQDSAIHPEVDFQSPDLQHILVLHYADLTCRDRPRP